VGFDGWHGGRGVRHFIFDQAHDFLVHRFRCALFEVYPDLISDRADSFGKSARVCNSLDFYGHILCVHNRLSFLDLDFGFLYYGFWVGAFGVNACGYYQAPLHKRFFDWLLDGFFEQTNPLFSVGILSVRLTDSPGR